MENPGEPEPGNNIENAARHRRYCDCHKTILLALLHLSVDSIIK